MNPLTLVKRIQNINSKEASLGISEEASWHAKYKDSAYVFVGGIPFDLTEGDLLAVFAQYGEVVDVNLVRDKGTGKSKGFAFLAYEDQRSTNLAVDNLNGAQILGRIIRVDHVTKYKKKEEEDEETERKKREERGVCRAFQRGECTRGASCKFSHDEQRAANTGWGAPEDAGSKWRHEKFDGPKKEKKHGNNQSSHIPEAREHDHRREKRSRRHEDDELVSRAGEDRNRREDKQSRRRNDDDDMELERRDHHMREDTKSRKPDDDELEPRTRDSDRREEKRYRRQDDDDDFGTRSREERRSRQHREYDSASRSREDYDVKQGDRSNRHDTNRSDVKVKYDSNKRDEKRSRR
ncbi:zinc finger CCCH domain-containing protein 25 [Neltuma alba]|uniref:zinc finger CCCH domain-containing protein 25 n=1 Tax=Neltuma alba TaxID=207710 RepID=UPI0010A4F8C1|nr:zinc finger CCCH domain-containing protein 25-like [Prosopis alba]